jgi:alcohol dehydrogenase
VRSLVAVEKNRVEWRETREPKLGGEPEAIVQPVAGSRCDYDRDLVRGASPLPMPFRLGHEAVAQVVDVGDGVRSVEPGDLAVVVWHICCGECQRCRAGRTGHCERVPPGSAYGTGGDWGGLFDDLVRVPYADAMLTPLPTGLDPLDAVAAGDSLGLGEMIVSRNLDLLEGRVAIFGRGEHGLYQVAFAIDRGFGAVHYVDSSDERRNIATQLGAESVAASPAEADGPYDLIVDAAGNEEWLHGAISVLAPEGTIECLGGYFDDIRIPGLFSYINGATIRCGVGNNGPHVAPTLEAVSRGAVKPSQLWAATVAWEDLPAAYPEESRKLVSSRERASWVATS